MKKILKLFLLVTMVFSLAACGGKESVDAQKKVVNDFFAYMKNANFDKIKEIMTDDGYQDVKKLQKVAASSFDQMLDGDTYGDDTVQATQTFLDHTFEKLFKDTKITNVTIKNGKTVIKIKGKMATFDELKNLDTSTAIQNLSSDFENNEESKNQLMEIYLSQGQAAMKKYLYNAILPKFLEEATKLIDKSSYQTYDATFTLVEKNGKWLIDSIV